MKMSLAFVGSPASAFASVTSALGGRVAATEGGDVFQAESFLPCFSLGDKRTQGAASFSGRLDPEAAAQKQGGSHFKFSRSLTLASPDLMAVGVKVRLEGTSR